MKWNEIKMRRLSSTSQRQKITEERKNLMEGKGEIILQNWTREKSEFEFYGGEHLL
jgi:hypothetical protein